MSICGAGGDVALPKFGRSGMAGVGDSTTGSGVEPNKSERSGIEGTVAMVVSGSDSTGEGEADGRGTFAVVGRS